ncbi:hypothetical protein [Xenorhabdus bovienii]|uniref:hypothetical protein n=1 Tax=Xenorhabdus bovienii TaxID=40576 RepID=UPI00237D2D60|nr:hypothetical protein [Xenorhabdus bovienii]MDE1484482.1 hypothetical protein [Xenorhabdus bovienii]
MSYSNPTPTHQFAAHNFPNSPNYPLISPIGYLLTAEYVRSRRHIIAWGCVLSGSCCGDGLQKTLV